MMELIIKKKKKKTDKTPIPQFSERLNDISLIYYKLEGILKAFRYGDLCKLRSKRYSCIH